MSSDLRKSQLFALFFLIFGCTYLSANTNTNYPPTDSTTSTSRLELAEKAQLLRSFIVDHAKQYLGLRYRYGGSTPGTGFDCSGLTSYVMNQFKIELQRCSRGQALQGKGIALSDARPGDLITFRRSRRSAVSHVALVAYNDASGVYIIHSTSRGVVLENLQTSAYWRPKVFNVRDVISEMADVAVLPQIPHPLLQQLAGLSEADRQVMLQLPRRISLLAI